MQFGKANSVQAGINRLLKKKKSKVIPVKLLWLVASGVVEVAEMYGGLLNLLDPYLDLPDEFAVDNPVEVIFEEDDIEDDPSGRYIRAREIWPILLSLIDRNTVTLRYGRKRNVAKRYIPDEVEEVEDVAPVQQYQDDV